jgi:tetratricopeptide (TPR) repeat protein
MKIELIYPIIAVCLSLALGSASIAASDQGVELFNQGRFQEAVPVLEAESKKKPADASLHYYLGNAYGNLNDHARAVQHYNLAIKCEPNSTAAKYSKMALLNYIGNEPAQTAPPPNPDEHAHAQAMVSAVKTIRRQADEHPMNQTSSWGWGRSRYYARPANLDQSASNLEQLLDAGEGPSGVSLKPEGTNLYIRNYKTPESIYLRHKGLSAPQDKLVFDGKKPAEKAKK